MRSIKPGRGPSMMGGIVGIFMCCIGVVWTMMAAQASGLFALFGVFWTCMALATTIYNFKNATGENRYSVYDITDAHEEPDPFNERFGKTREFGQSDDETLAGENRFCPYCGTAVEDDFEYCNSCGKKLP